MKKKKIETDKGTKKHSNLFNVNIGKVFKNNFLINTLSWATLLPEGHTRRGRALQRCGWRQSPPPGRSTGRWRMRPTRRSRTLAMKVDKVRKIRVKLEIRSMKGQNLKRALQTEGQFKKRKGIASLYSSVTLISYI